MKILVIDDHVVVREGVQRLLATLPDIEVIEVEDARDALTAYRKSLPSLVILDINLDGSSGLEFLQRLLVHDKSARIIMFTMHAEPSYVARAIRAGAMGYVSKSSPADELIEAVNKVAAGERYIARALANSLASGPNPSEDPYHSLSNREVEILRLLGEGKSVAQIAATFGIAYKTVANSCTALKTKLGLQRTADLIRLSIERRDR
ncbi:MAG: DNA-binding response regulator [Hyphomicrobium sp.]|nr:DNA-binding response regulator [Hyphomicrobium sp.]